jgi:hypothetical protein
MIYWLFDLVIGKLNPGNINYIIMRTYLEYHVRYMKEQSWCFNDSFHIQKHEIGWNL